jgi:hypothetical protein
MAGNDTYVPGDPVRIKDDAATVFAGREDAWVRYADEENRGYYLRAAGY